ncbi:MAG: RNA polymerase sigma factor [Candidatus Limnocylindrales bacterium]
MEQELRREAVERAHRDHADDVYRVAYAILGDAEAAADATQETFARAFARWHQYDSDRPLMAWLHGIVSHAALDALRRRRVMRLTQVVLERHAEVAESAAASGGDDRSGSLDRHVIEAELARLRPQARAALVLRHVYGYDYAAIGGFLGTSAGNVGALLSRSHALLRERLAELRPPRPGADRAAANR